MQLNDFLQEKGIDPFFKRVLVMRHTPTEPELKKKFLSIAEERPDLFNAYQSTQRKKQEKQLQKANFLASFVGHEPKKAVFVGLYKVGGKKPLSHRAYWKNPVHNELKRIGMRGFVDSRKSILKFDLKKDGQFDPWKGKLIVDWPGTDLAWSRWATKRNKFSVIALLEESKLIKAMPDWTEIIWPHSQLKTLPRSWQDKLSQWRGIYYVFDYKRRKGYVGSAYGHDNILGRWRNWSRTGHGGNKHLRESNPKNLVFSILEIDSHNRTADEIIKKETSWKERLHTYWPMGLNGN